MRRMTLEKIHGTPSGELRRNHTHLRLRTDTLDIQGETLADERSSTGSHRPMTRSQTGTDIRPPYR